MNIFEIMWNIKILKTQWEYGMHKYVQIYSYISYWYWRRTQGEEESSNNTIRFENPLSFCIVSTNNQFTGNNLFLKNFSCLCDSREKIFVWSHLFNCEVTGLWGDSADYCARTDSLLSCGTLTWNECRSVQWSV